MLYLLYRTCFEDIRIYVLLYHLCTYYCAGLNNDVRCFWCDLVLRNWESGEDPWVEHARWFPRCAFIRQTRGDEFVDMVQNAFSQKVSLRMCVCVFFLFFLSPKENQ